MRILPEFMRASALAAALVSTSGCVVGVVIPVGVETHSTTTTRVIQPTASDKFQGCAEAALDRYTGAGAPTATGANQVSQNGYTLTQDDRGSVRVNTPVVSNDQLPAVSANANNMLAAVMACKR